MLTEQYASFPELTIRVVQERIKDAKRNGMSLVEAAKEDEAQQALALSKNVNREEYALGIRQMTENPKRFVLFPNPHELLPYIRALTNEGYHDLFGAFHHELEHWRAAIDEGFTPLIGFYFINHDNIGLYRSIQLFTIMETIPEEMTDAEYLERLTRVAIAPTQLSEGDKLFLR